MILISYPRVLAVSPIPQRPSYLSLLSFPRGICSAANTPWAPSYVILIQYPRVLAVPPIRRKPLIRNIYFTPEGIGGAANTSEDPQTYLSLLIAVFIKMIINLEHMNLSMISLNQVIHIFRDNKF
jgi:hypothetical protein